MIQEYVPGYWLHYNPMLQLQGLSGILQSKRKGREGKDHHYLGKINKIIGNVRVFNGRVDVLVGKTVARCTIMHLVAAIVSYFKSVIL